MYWQRESITNNKLSCIYEVRTLLLSDMSVSNIDPYDICRTYIHEVYDYKSKRQILLNQS